MEDIVNRLKHLATHSDYVKLYQDFDKSLVAKNMGKITGEVDRPYMDFLAYTNGASVLDYCFMGFKNRALGANLYENIRELWQMDNLLTFRFWGCVGDSTGNAFGYLDKKNKFGGHYFGYYSTNSPGTIYLVASSFVIFMDKFLTQVERVTARNRAATGLDSNAWFMDRANLLEGDEEMRAFLTERQGTEYSLK